MKTFSFHLHHPSFHLIKKTVMPIIGPHVGFKGGRESCEDMACIYVLFATFISRVVRFLTLFVCACGSHLYVCIFVFICLFIAT